MSTDYTATEDATVPIAVRVATIQIVLPYRGEDDGEQVSEVLGALVDGESSEILDWRYLKVGGQYLQATTQTASVTRQGGHYIEGISGRSRSSSTTRAASARTGWGRTGSPPST